MHFVSFVIAALHSKCCNHCKIYQSLLGHFCDEMSFSHLRSMWHGLHVLLFYYGFCDAPFEISLNLKIATFFKPRSNTCHSAFSFSTVDVTSNRTFFVYTVRSRRLGSVWLLDYVRDFYFIYTIIATRLYIDRSSSLWLVVRSINPSTNIFIASTSSKAANKRVVSK